MLTEAALRSRLCSPEVLLGQLDRLSSLAGLPNVKLGIIEFRTRCDTPALHDFWVFDGKQVQIEMFSAELTLKQPQEIELYVKIFEDLAAAASYGRAARALITKVVDELAAEVGDDEDS
ncbi:hypothetical protein EV193_103384 [Herbihabitans rhizosphaerae]|uniref:DUF5753 domain-containing protein n=1 Tax=Herbihabitans rhizosphaerae TaxID=1872711 RepID=A0A4Q7KWU1_9PSEU|nr:hypothetical protein EV193_103384 [Herbihabitans rhizosphaerae]